MNEEIKPENVRIHSRADELIACLEGEIAKRDEELAACRVAVENCDLFRARIVELESQYQRDVYGLNNEGDPIGGDPAGGYANDNARLRTELAAIKAPDTVGEVVGWYRLDRPYEMTSYQSVCATWHKLGAPVAPLYADPAVPAADAGIVDMYRHLQKVTPYRFKKIQDASITDGGDVMYFHKDRFDAALLADMAAHCAAKGVV